MLILFTVAFQTPGTQPNSQQMFSEQLLSEWMVDLSPKVGGRTEVMLLTKSAHRTSQIIDCSFIPPFFSISLAFDRCIHFPAFLYKLWIVHVLVKCHDFRAGVQEDHDVRDNIAAIRRAVINCQGHIINLVACSAHGLDLLLLGCSPACSLHSVYPVFLLSFLIFNLFSKVT